MPSLGRLENVAISRRLGKKSHDFIFRKVPKVAINSDEVEGWYFPEITV